jgi:hypothetical protein
MTTALLLTLTLTAGQAPATPPVAQLDSRFDNWLGCWRLEDDLSGNGVRLCIVPAGTGVRLQTIVGTQRGIDETVVADGIARPITDSDCKGTEQAEWSKDGLHLFRTTNVTCAADGPRLVKSVAFLAPGSAWVNVQHVGGPLSASVRVQRYRRAFNQNLADGSKAAQPPATAIPLSTDQLAWSVDDVIEAAALLPAPALEAALTEVRHGFNVNKQTLLALDRAEVPESVIDLMIALTFPQRFKVDRPGGDNAIGISTGGGWFDPFMSPYLMGGMYANCYTPWGYGYRTYYGYCGGYYSYYNYGYPYYPYGGWGYVPPGWVVVPNPPTPGPAPVEGRVVNGRGYTQVRPRDPEPAPVRTTSRGDGTASGYSGSRGGGVSSQGYSSGSSGSSSSSGGSSGGSNSSGSGSGGRTAVPRPGGGE